MSEILGFELSVYKERLAKVQAALPEGALALLRGGVEQTRNNDVEHAFRQHSDFVYLTGFEEPDAALLITPETAMLLVRPKDKTMEIWTGFRFGPEGAAETFGFEHTAVIDELEAKLLELGQGAPALVCAFDDDVARDMLGAVQTQLSKMGRKGVVAPAQWHDLNPLIHEARVVKSDAEIDMMRAAGAISARAHRRAMCTVKAGVFEYQLQANIEHEHRMAGSAREAYGAIVAGGNNANVLHYISNRDACQDGDLVLIDAGCELNYYAADITRTFPVSGQFSDAQARVYDWVLKAQAAALEKVKPGEPMTSYHEAAVEVLIDAMIDLELLSGTHEEIKASESYRKYYMHGTGHLLGMDVHDVGRYKVDGESRALQPNMVITVEPGLYIEADDTDAPEALRGIGIRIEDDVRVTQNGHEILTAGVPKSRQDIEALQASGAWQ